MVSEAEIRDCDHLIEPSKELLFRQIATHLWDFDSKRPSSHAFGPATSDCGMPSFARSNYVTAQASRDWHQCHANSPSEAVFACSAEDVVSADARAIDDSKCVVESGKQRSPGHCFVDYRGYSKTEERLLRAILLAKAIELREVYTIDIRRPLDELSPDEIGFLFKEAQRWSVANGRTPSKDSGDRMERRHAEVLGQAEVSQNGSQ